MTKGGARNRSGPAADPNSGRSDRRGFSLTALPAEGYDGEAPVFPLQPAVVHVMVVDESGVKRRFPDEDATQDMREREQELWEWAWSLPQAAAWAREPWRWHTVAMWVRTAVVCEGPDAQAADKNSLHRFADQIGMTPAGLRENGWAIAVDEFTSRRAEPDEDEDDPRTRLTVVSNGGA